MHYHLSLPPTRFEEIDISIATEILFIFECNFQRCRHRHRKTMAKDKETPKKDKKSKKIKSTDLSKELGDPANTSTDIILSPALDKPRESLGGVDDEDFYESRLPAQAPFAKPLAPKKLNKKVLKTIKKGTHPSPISVQS